MSQNITPSQAAEQLAAADTIARPTQVFNAAWASFIFFAAAGSIMVLGEWIAANYDVSHTPALIIGLTWNTIGVLVAVFAGRSTPIARRGFSNAWKTALGLWIASVVIGTAWPFSPYLALVFPILAAAGILLELRAVKR